jgi:hypothetical protein
MLVLTRDEENMKIFSRRKGFAPRTQPCRMWTVEFWFFDATMKRLISKQTRKARGTIARVALVLNTSHLRTLLASGIDRERGKDGY